MSRTFWKMEAQGNDFVFVDVRETPLPEDTLPEMAIKVCDRHFGIGADGLVLVDTPRRGGDILMRVYNSDGSSAEICGSALRCLVAWLGHETGRRQFVVETLHGEHPGTVLQAEPDWITAVDMGVPEFIEEATAEGFTGDRVRVENPHFVLFLEAFSEELFAHYGQILEQVFPGGTNVHFAQRLDAHTLRLHTHERGAGATLACGSGAVATVFSALRRELLTLPATLRQPGGEVRVECSANGHFVLLGNVHWVFHGYSSLLSS